ncbi:MAG: DUF4038 domain-containing protein [Actinobacteria bacterium]|nr:DUF4038 domain-containing protein [Actinomycetota bacterium]
MQEFSKKYHTEQNLVLEISFISAKKYKNPFEDAELDIIVTNPDGKELVVPTFWAGENTWRFRYSSSIIGKHNFITKCSVTDDLGLNNQCGVIDISEYDGEKILYRHGRIRVNSNSKYLEHLDNTPFFWLGDTWWFGFAERCKWPEIFKIITEDRLRKGYSVIQIVAGLYPDFGKEFNKLEANEAGYVWDNEFKCINPAYFDMADLKVFWLVNSGLMPCIFGAWGYYLPWLGIEKMKKHWRYIIARWGAYPVVWSVAGEVRLPYYPYLLMDYSKREKIIKNQTLGWAEIAKYIHQTDPFNNLITAHPSPGDSSFSSREIFHDSSLYDINMLQTGHRDKNDFKKTLEVLQNSLNCLPQKPVINGEVCYEGIMGSNLQDTQRFLFWTHILSGAAGHTYGADGIWTFRSEENYIGETGRWSSDKWDKAMDFPGSYQIGLSKKFLEKFEWYKFESYPEWVTPHQDKNNRYFPYCAGIPYTVRVIYIPGLYLQKNIFCLREIKINSIEENSNYKAYFFDPRNGTSVFEMEVTPNEKGEWSVPINCGLIPTPSMEDWVLVLENYTNN